MDATSSIGVADREDYDEAQNALKIRIAGAQDRLAAAKERCEIEEQADLHDETKARHAEKERLQRLDEDQEREDAERLEQEHAEIAQISERLEHLANADAHFSEVGAPTSLGDWIKEFLPWTRNAKIVTLKHICNNLDEAGFGRCTERDLSALRTFIEDTLDSRGAFRDRQSKIQNQQEARKQRHQAARNALIDEITEARQRRSAQKAQRDAVRAKTMAAAEDALAKIRNAAETLESAYGRFEAECRRITGESAPRKFAEIPGKIDTTLRVKAFLLATHYWEARFLRGLKGSGWRSQGNRAGAFRRIAMLAPCFVSTFDKIGTAFNVMKQDTIHPMWDLADGLIIDEAGQASPDKGAFAFAFAKKALVVGDTLQLPPVNSTDAGTILASIARSSKLLDDQFCADHGLLAGKVGKQDMPGSLMRMASAASYYDMSATTSGMWLRDHFRCDPRIIAFNNRIWYTGEKSLAPQRPQQQDLMTPHFGHVNVTGTTRNKSNEAEALAIMTWLNHYGAELQRRYGEPLHKIVAVLTPFTNQRRLLRTIRDNRFQWRDDYESPDQIVMGTVHALQGAERHIILFSTVYDTPKPNYFFDFEHTLLNVAVSRAKDSFIVFGNRRIFSENPSTGKPSSLLRDHLFDERLFEVPPLPDIRRQ